MLHPAARRAQISLIPRVVSDRAHWSWVAYLEKFFFLHHLQRKVTPPCTNDCRSHFSLTVILVSLNTSIFTLMGLHFIVLLYTCRMLVYVNGIVLCTLTGFLCSLFGCHRDLTTLANLGIALLDLELCPYFPAVCWHILEAQ